ncbi:MAG TPA: DinB family protein [Noviherbaspirillum sp.]|uniref:DinB family protein n=1 Tax=Noviherbaspirillum sp. TaxID=1926288 RepID=UPI002B459835|nr:DinB family protein [Noviherbaspirillum sp.]HJV85524.1 DinB family protein [Noviherbaspirillum sp.]
MITPGYVQTVARYNRWMNEKIVQACDRISDQERKADRGAFFKSIHSTLNHILWGDTTWLGRFTHDTPLAKSYPKAAIGSDLFEDWHVFKEARSAVDEDVLAWAASIDADWLARDFSWYSGITRSNRTRPAWLLVTHMFNHQTHHRGQVTTLLSQQGIDPGDTDLMLMPL